MAMKELARMTLDAKMIRAAVELAVSDRALKSSDEEAIAIDVPDELAITVVIRRKRTPKKGKA